jgi:hypothetical protein
MRLCIDSSPSMWMTQELCTMRSTIASAIASPPSFLAQPSAPNCEQSMGDPRVLRASAIPSTSRASRPAIDPRRKSPTMSDFSPHRCAPTGYGKAHRCTMESRADWRVIFTSWIRPDRKPRLRRIFDANPASRKARKTSASRNSSLPVFASPLHPTGTPSSHAP